MLILAIILFGMIVGAAAQLIIGRKHGSIDWTMAIVAGLVELGDGVGGHGRGVGGVTALDRRPAGEGRDDARDPVALRDELSRVKGVGDVQVFGLVGDDESVLTLATGIGGLAELSFQVAPSRRGTEMSLASVPSICAAGIDSM